MEISAILTDMANGNVAPEVAHRLRATNLTVLRKPNKKFRPDRRRVCMGKSHITHGGGRGHASPQTCFKNLQYGVGNNIELAIQKIRRDFHLKGSVAMLDGRNAYNAISRTAILSAVYGNTAWSPLWRVTRLLLGTEGWWASTKRANWSTRGSRRVECAKAWCWDRSYSPSAPSPPSANWKAAFPTPASRAYLDDVDGGGTTGHAGEGCARRPPGRWRALGIETNEDKTEVLNKGGPVDMPTEYIRPFARVLGAGSSKTTQRAS
ncbi:hypothetical protein TcBrA4_0073030 [Trypanosoma cruzi]|nr:hypothetical protein TcBrA4_0073030 [Trypanosoma cruzi]